MRLHTTEEIGASVRDARRRRKLTQAHLAEMIGASRQWIQRLEVGKPGVELGLTLRALLAVGVTLEARGPTGSSDVTPAETKASWLLHARQAGKAAASPVANERAPRRPAAVHARPPRVRAIAIPGWNDAPTPVDAPDAVQLRSEQRAVTAPRRTP